MKKKKPEKDKDDPEKDKVKEKEPKKKVKSVPKKKKGESGSHGNWCKKTLMKPNGYKYTVFRQLTLKRLEIF